MTITRLHMAITVLIALVLHGGAAMWLALPAPEPFRDPPAKALNISLLATIAETTVAETPAPPLEPISQPIAEPAPAPKPRPVVKPKPRPQLPVPQPVKKVLEPEQFLKPAPAETRVVPLDAVATARYEQLLVAWLEKHKIYPRRARRLRIEGEGMLRILIDRAGQTQRVALEQRTGNRLLDKAALDMVKRATPFPSMPENDPRRELEFIVPVAFVLR